MASVRLIGRTWFACITLPNGKRTQISTKKRDVGSTAERAECRKQANLIAQTTEDLVRGDPTEAHLRATLDYLFARVGNKARVSRPTDAHLGEWLQRVKLHQAASTYSRYRGITTSFLNSLGARRVASLAELTVADFQSWVDGQLVEGKRPSSVHSAWQTLCIPFALAVKHGFIATNPARLAQVPKGSRKPNRLPFTIDQISAIFRIAEGDWRTAIMLAVFTGARLMDACSMQWSAVDLGAGVVRYLPQKTRRSGLEVIIPLHPALFAYLKELRRQQSVDSAWLCPGLQAGPRGGRPVLSDQFKGLLVRAGIDPAHPDDKILSKAPGTRRHRIPRYCFHSFRHSFASHLANAGVSRELRMQLIGHTTENIHSGYSHIAVETLRSAVMQLPQICPEAAGAVPDSAMESDVPCRDPAHITQTR